MTTTNPATFQANYVPPGWPTPGVYHAFKIGCRVCRISWDDAPSVQFATEADFDGYGYPLCTGLYMPPFSTHLGSPLGHQVSLESQ